MKYRLGIDLGTSYFKFGIYDQNLTLKGLGRVTVEKDTGNGTLCEVPADRFIRLLKKGITQACRQAEISPAQIDAIGYSSQANSFILLDKHYQSLTPLVLWPDGRAGKLYPEVERLWNDDVFLKTTGIGTEPSSQLCINKLLWFKYNCPNIWKEVGHIMTISDYLVYLFTGLSVGDLGTGSLLGLIDCENSRYWNNAFETLNLDIALFSSRLSVGDEIGQTNDTCCNLFGLKRGVSLCAGSLDHHMAGLGAGLEETAALSISIGTVVACVNLTNRYIPQKNVCISPWKDNQFCQLTFNENGATSLEWYKNNFAEQHSIEELNKMAAEVGNSNGLTAKPAAFKYSILETAFENIKPNHTHGHFIYALMESTANTLKELVLKLCLSHKPEKIVATGGGARSDLWLKICSEKLNANVFRSGYPEPATKGATMLAQQNF